jgi:hypothetical protein
MGNGKPTPSSRHDVDYTPLDCFNRWYLRLKKGEICLLDFYRLLTGGRFPVVVSRSSQLLDSGQP